MAEPRPEAFDVAVVGGGPAGAATATRLAGAGLVTLLVERTREPHWRACGVFSSPLTRSRLLDLGVAPGQLNGLATPIAGLDLQTTRGVRCRLEYEHGPACGFDRVRLDAALLERAREAGAEVRRGVVVRKVRLPARSGQAALLDLSPTIAGPSTKTVAANVVVGADGPRSLIARTARVARTTRLLRRAGITFHRADPTDRAAGSARGRFVFGSGWYVGVAPVPDGRVNVGMVVPPEMLRLPPGALVERLLAEFPEPRERWMSAATTDRMTVAYPLHHSVSRVAGRAFALVGDATGFIDPLTGEGIHRALVSADLAAEAIIARLRGDTSALDGYDRHLRARFRNKNAMSWLLQLFLSRPRLFDYALRRLERRADLRATLTLVLADQLRASSTLDPRFLARLLAP
jgi:flavin-dependent dehydrogenase